MRKTALITHPACERHEMGAGHPERPARIRAILEALASEGIDKDLRFLKAPLAKDEHLTRVHPAAYVEKIRASAPAKDLAWLDGDTAMNEHSLEAALRAAGAVILAIDQVMKKEVDNAFCCVRPPGHHAERARAMGFCLFNNVAIGAAHVLHHHGRERVAILDFDVHHGNGTEDIFAAEPRVLLCSSFQHPFYPGTPFTEASPHMCNVPLSAGLTSQEFRQAISDRWLPALEEFQPEFILISAGFDAHREDPLAQFELIEDDYAWVTALAQEMAKKYAHGHIVSTLEGGYDLPALGKSAVAHVKGLMQIT